MATLRLRISSVLFVIHLYLFCGSATGDDANLKSLYDGHRWFQLRASVERGGAPAFYQGAVACAFNDVHSCEKKLQAVVKSAPRSNDAVEAHRMLASTYLIHGKYKNALSQVDAILKLRPSDSDALGEQPLLSILAAFHDQQLVGQHTMVELRDDALPFSINGVQAAYWFDTGAGLSVLSEGEAKRFGLTVYPVSAKVGDVNGTQVNTRIAVADEIAIGSLRLKHVAFLVLPDDQPPFNELSVGSRGLIGMPVLLAFSKFAWAADKTFQIDARRSKKNLPHAELCFDGNHPLVQVEFKGRTLDFALDTGATTTDLYPLFSASFPELIRAADKTDSYRIEGVGGTINMNAATLASLQFRIGGFGVTLKPAHILLTSTTDSSKFFAGNLGIDLLKQAGKTTFNFRSMALTLQ